MGAGSESKSWGNNEIQSVGIGSSLPRRANPQLVADFDGLKLGSAAQLPVLVGKLIDLYCDLFANNPSEHRSAGADIHAWVEYSGYCLQSPAGITGFGYIELRRVASVCSAHRDSSKYFESFVYTVRHATGHRDRDLQPVCCSWSCCVFDGTTAQLDNWRSR